MENKSFTPINILWIEDNPLTNTLSADIINKRTGKELFDSTLSDIPAIVFKGENSEYFRFFNLKILQHPEEIKEYIILCNLVEDKYGPVALGQLDGVIPEVVAFDYQLADNIHINMEGDEKFYIPYDKKWESVRKYFNPNYNILAKYGLLTPYLESTDYKYKVDDFIKRINYIPAGENYNVNQDKSALIDNATGKGKDDLGLYSGIEILRLFRNHACVGIPATRNKAKRESLHAFSKYYEWLNENDLSTALDRKERENKSWDSIIEDGVKQLKIRIKTLVKSSKITPSFTQLKKLADGDITERTFSFNSIYGERILPLDGLFIDVPVITRDKEIAIWAGELLQNLPLSNEVIKESIVISNQLWNAYLNCFEDRMILSDYTYRLSFLNKEEKDYLVEVKKRLDIDTLSGLIADKKEFSIRTLTDEQKDKNIFRLSVLITVTTAAIELEKQRKESGNSEKYPPLSRWEYFNILFPKINLGNKLLLPMHYRTLGEKDDVTEKDRAWLFRNLNTKENRVTVGNLFQFEDWISKGEKEVLKSIFFNERKYYPDWVK